MIQVKSLDGDFELRWTSGAWRDKAGHVWTFDRDANLKSKEHGFVAAHLWKIPDPYWMQK